MKKIVYVLVLSSSILLLTSILSYGILHFGLSINFFSSTIAIEIRNKLLYVVYLTFFLTTISGVAYYKVYLK
jgi:hypothetical protein